MPREVKKELSRFANQLKKLDASLVSGVKWVEVDNLHITLKFLGETSEDQVNQVDGRCKEMCCEFFPFSAEISAFGAFPSKRQARVLWAGVKAEATLNQLWERLENELLELGFDKETHGFSPHITIGRNNSIKKLDILTPMFSNLQINKHKFMIDEFTLYKSELRPNGPRYTAIKRYRLGATA